MADVFPGSSKSRKKQQRRRVEVRKKEFHYHGLSLEQLQGLSLDELMPLLSSRVRRTLKRGLTKRQNKLLEDVKKAQHGDIIKTHCRDMVILPDFIGHRIEIYTGKEFQRVDIQPQMVGHYLGEFALTRKRPKHTGPGVGATRGSKFMPLK
ncbi:MAG: 30S ribosomal protein S19 [Methanobacteriota archaeon]